MRREIHQRLIPCGVRVSHSKSVDRADRSTVRQPPLVREHARLPAAVASGLGIVFESSTGCIETPPDVASTVAKSAFGYISRHLPYTPTGFRFRRGNPWGFKSLLEH